MEPHVPDPAVQLGLLASIPTQLQMAREYALLGNYEVSINYYDVCLGNIGKFVRSITSTSDRKDWFSLKEKLQSEVKLIKEVQTTLAVFRQPPGSRSAAATTDGLEDSDDPERWPPPASLPPSHHSKYPSAPVVSTKRAAAASGAHGVAASGFPVPGSGPPSWAAAPPATTAAVGRPSLVRAASFGSGAPPPRGRAPAAPQPSGGPQAGKPAVGTGGASSGVGVKPPAAGALGKPPVPRQPPVKSTGSAKPVATGPHGRQKYSELHHLAADTELIAMVENDILDVNPSTTFDSIAGLEEAKGLINEAVVLPMLIPGYFQGIRRPWKGVLLFGPPGTGKTLLAKAVATECKITFFNVTASTLTSKWRGESERIVRILFDMARYYAPSVIFIDEVDSLAGARGGSNEHEASRRVKTELLVQMDGVSSLVSSKDADDAAAPSDGDGSDDPPVPKQVVVLAASNLPWELDDAFRRRLEKRIYIPLPSLGDRELMFGVQMGDVPLGDDVDLAQLAARTDGYSGADIASVCRTAAMMPMRRILEEGRRTHGNNVAAMQKMLADRGVSEAAAKLPVEMAHFLDAIAATKPSVGHADAKKYEQWMAEFGSV